MIVVSDTSPVTGLLTIGEADVLPRLFGEVIIPEAVSAELLRSHSEHPPWLRVVSVHVPSKVDIYTQTVDKGEAEAIALAGQLEAERLLIDERKGRKLAMEEGIPVIGLLGVVVLAKRKGFIASGRDLLLRLEREAGMYIDKDVLDSALRTINE